MRIQIITQPFNSENAPQNLAEQLISLLASRDPFYDNVWIISAFAHQGAILRLSPNILSSKNNGGRIHFVVGINHHGTSTEALQRLLELNLDAKIFNNQGGRYTFHPKIYLFEATGFSAELFIGSNNLTYGGLYTNYESFSQLSFSFEEDAEIYDQLKRSINRFINPPDGISQQLTQAIIDLLIARSDILSENSSQFNQSEEVEDNPTLGQEIDTNTNIPASPFGTERIPHPPYARLPTQRRPVHERRFTNVPTTSEGSAVPPVQTTRELLWRKRNLPRSDVQSQEGNVTGGLRLTQAGWLINGNPIDQTTFFRNNLFGQAEWTTGQRAPNRRETASIPFEVIILGQNYGVHDITISHKPSGEAGQRNYTTMLHWGELGGIIQELNLVSRNFSLYGALPGDQTRFRIEIT